MMESREVERTGIRNGMVMTADYECVPSQGMYLSPERGLQKISDENGRR